VPHTHTHIHTFTHTYIHTFTHVVCSGAAVGRDEVPGAAAAGVEGKGKREEKEPAVEEREPPSLPLEDSGPTLHSNVTGSSDEAAQGVSSVV
jgi:hypothetical protein